MSRNHTTAPVITRGITPREYALRRLQQACPGVSTDALTAVLLAPPNGQKNTLDALVLSVFPPPRIVSRAQREQYAILTAGQVRRGWQITCGGVPLLSGAHTWEAPVDAPDDLVCLHWDGFRILEGVFVLQPPSGREADRLFCVYLPNPDSFTAESTLAVLFYRGTADGFAALLRAQQRARDASCAADRTRINRSVDVANDFTTEYSLDTAVGWDDLVCSPTIQHEIKEDFAFYLQQRDWFRRNKIAAKRSYLLLAPPGNGKTSIARILCLTPGFRALTFDFNQSGFNTDSDLASAFRQAEGLAPCFFLLEDLDRLFAPESRVEVSLACLLNCLDGVSTHSGVSVIATANDESVLDPALLRPGRFDRIVRLTQPAYPQRRLFLERLFGESADAAVAKETLDDLAAAATGLSMSMIKEVFVSAGKEAFVERTAVICDTHALRALASVKARFGQASRPRAGFGH